MAGNKKRFYIETQTLITMVERLQRGEPGADTDIYIAFRDKIYGHIVKRAESTEIADELIDEVFTEIFNTIRKLKNPEAFVTWCNRITEHQIAGYFRKKRSLIAAEAKNKKEQVTSCTLVTDNETIAAEMLGFIKEKHARVIRMHVIERIPVKKIALMEGVPEGTIKSRLHYGRKALKKALSHQKVTR